MHRAPTVVSADSHIDLSYLPEDTFAARMDPSWGDQIPRVAEIRGERRWLSGGADLGSYGPYEHGSVTGSKGQVFSKESFGRQGVQRPGDPALRVADQELDGVDIEVIYGITGVTADMGGKRGLKSPALVTAVYEAYNEFIAGFERERPGRFVGLACLPNHDPAVAAQVLRKSAQLGLRGAVLVPWGGALPIWHRGWDVLWHVAQETEMVISFHAFEGGTRIVSYDVEGPQRNEVNAAVTVVAPMQMDEVLVSLILCGTCERFPRLRFVLGEAGIGWIPYALERLDHTYRARLTDLGLPLLPSEYFRRQMYATFQHDAHGVRAMAEIAPDNVMWGSDYPHHDSTWPESRASIEQQFKGVDPAIRDKMLCRNALHVYGLDREAAAGQARARGGARGASAALEVAGAAHAELTRRVQQSFAKYHKAPWLKVPEPTLIRAGRAGGLPFDSLTSDLQLGCLPAKAICYGSCFAARASFEAGFDFSERVDNILDEAVLRGDLARIHAAQGYLRNGWNSDPSWRWSVAARLAELVRESGRLPIFVTKCFKAPSVADMARLAAAGAELRISISAFDADEQLRQRLSTAAAYRSAGGVVIPLVMTTRFRDAALDRRQDAIVDHVCQADFPGAENSLRIPTSSAVFQALDPEAHRPLANGDVWCGRLYPDRLKAPTTTSVPQSYAGLPSARLSEIDEGYLQSLFVDPVRTHAEVLRLPLLQPPRMCGVPLAWSQEADEPAPEPSEALIAEAP
jgi:predicted TIM-barrel fold metal-dependent hydrolase